MSDLTKGLTDAEHALQAKCEELGEAASRVLEVCDLRRIRLVKLEAHVAQLEEQHAISQRLVDSGDRQIERLEARVAELWAALCTIDGIVTEAEDAKAMHDGVREVTARALASSPSVSNDKTSTGGPNPVDDLNRKERDDMRASSEKLRSAEGSDPLLVAESRPTDQDVNQPHVVCKSALADRAVKSADHAPRTSEACPHTLSLDTNPPFCAQCGAEDPWSKAQRPNEAPPEMSSLRQLWDGALAEDLKERPRPQEATPTSNGDGPWIRADCLDCDREHGPCEAHEHRTDKATPEHQATVEGTGTFALTCAICGAETEKTYGTTIKLSQRCADCLWVAYLDLRTERSLERERDEAKHDDVNRTETPSLDELGPRYEAAKSARDAYLDALFRVFQAYESGDTFAIVFAMHDAVRAVDAKLPGVDMRAPRLVALVREDPAWVRKVRAEFAATPTDQRSRDVAGDIEAGASVPEKSEEDHG